MMSGSVIQLIAAALSGPVVWGTVIYLWRRLRRDPKTQAETRKLNEEAEDIFVTRLWAEIDRLDRDLKAMRSELTAVKVDAADEKALLEKENHQLRLEVGSLRRRVGQLEEIIKTKTTPEDMRAQLEAIDRRASDK